MIFLEVILCQKSIAHIVAAKADLAGIESTLTVLTSAGFRGRDRVIAQRTVVSFLLGVLQNEYYGPLSGPGTAAMAQLSTEDYPLLTETAAEARTPSGWTEPVARPIPHRITNGTASPRTAQVAPETLARATSRPLTKVIVRLVQLPRSRSPVTLVAAIAATATRAMT